MIALRAINWRSSGNGEEEMYKELFVSTVGRTITTLDNDEVTALGRSALRSCANLLTVNLPNVTTVEGQAFDGCSALESVSLNGVLSLQSVGSLFYGCSKLKVIHLDSVTSIGSVSNWLYGCSQLADLHIPKMTIAQFKSVNYIDQHIKRSGITLHLLDGDYVWDSEASDWVNA